MKFGNYIVCQHRPIDKDFLLFYSEAHDTMYGVFRMEEYTHGNKETVEDSYKVYLTPSLCSQDLFYRRAWYCCDLSHSLCKEFDLVNEPYKAVGFCNVQNERLQMLREIKKNPNKHIEFVDNGVVHYFYYDDKNGFYETENGTPITNEDGSLFSASMHEMEKVMFSIDWEYSNPMCVKWNSKWLHFKNILGFKS